MDNTPRDEELWDTVVWLQHELLIARILLQETLADLARGKPDPAGYVGDLYERISRRIDSWEDDRSALSYEALDRYLSSLRIHLQESDGR